MEIAERHHRGIYEIACDAEANEHYGISNRGLHAFAWRVRCYIVGFLTK